MVILNGDNLSNDVVESDSKGERKERFSQKQKLFGFLDLDMAFDAEN